MRICVLANNTRQDNGWGRFAFEFISALRRAGADAIILTEDPNGSFPDEHVVLDNSLRFSLLDGLFALLHLPFVLRNSWRVRRFVRQCDVVHALDGYPYSVIAACALIGSETPLVTTLQGTYSLDVFNHLIESRLFEWALRRTKLIVCISRYVAERVQAHIPGLSVEVIGHGTTPRWLTQPREESELPVSRPYILSVGAIKPQKGYRTSLAAFARVKGTFPGLSYAIVGYQGHAHFEEIKGHVRGLGIEKSVHFLTNVSDQDLIRLYDGAELFMLTPVSMGGLVEGFGLVYREASARGLAVIASRDSGAADAVRDGVTGILCPQGDAPAVAKAIEALLTDPSQRSSLGRAGKMLAHEETWDWVAGAYSNLFNRVRAPD